MMKTPILVGTNDKSRVLRPNEYETIKSWAKNNDKINLDCVLLLGARYTECQEIQEHPEWLDSGKFIGLPHERKHGRKGQQRFIRLSGMGADKIPMFFSNKKLPTPQTLGENLRRWARFGGIDDSKIGVKCLRKTWESWLLYYYPHRQLQIFKSQGHSEITAFEHDVNMPFTDEEERIMKKYVEGW